MKYLALGRLQNEGQYREIGVVEGPEPIHAEQNAVAQLDDDDKRDWRKGKILIKLYMLPDEFNEKRNVVTQSELNSLHDEEFQKSLARMEAPEGGWPKGSDMDRL